MDAVKFEDGVEMLKVKKNGSWNLCLTLRPSLGPSVTALGRRGWLSGMEVGLLPVFHW
jgi:hypothetical protein